nr:hypothetical protein [Nonomuraea glycinis]
MPAASVVEVGDPGGDLQTGFGPRREVVLVDVFDLESGVERFSGGVVQRLTGHQRAGTFTALRSLFQLARRHRLIFADPTRRRSVGRAPARVLQPMTDSEIAKVKQAAVTPEQRLVVALAAVYAMRASAIRHLTLDDIDLPRRQIRLSGHH